MHSEALAVRTYFLFYSGLRSLAELCIFRSIHKYAHKIINCKKTFCSKIYGWPLHVCKDMAYLFPTHQASDDQLNKQKGAHIPIVQHETSMSLEQMRQILNYMAYKRMEKAIQRFSYPENALTSTHTLNILSYKSASVYTSSRRKTLFRDVYAVFSNIFVELLWCSIFQEGKQ